MCIRDSCTPGQATVSFSLDYEDSKATGAAGTETLSFQITQQARAKLEASDIPSVLYTMDTVEIPVKAMNLGRDKIYNASVRLEADGLNPKAVSYTHLAHELKTPMTAIIGYADTLLTVRLSPKRQEIALDYIRNECQMCIRDRCSVWVFIT